jgi:hypothetical protein
VIVTWLRRNSTSQPVTGWIVAVCKTEAVTMGHFTTPTVVSELHSGSHVWPEKLLSSRSHAEELEKFRSPTAPIWGKIHKLPCQGSFSESLNSRKGAIAGHSRAYILAVMAGLTQTCKGRGSERANHVPPIRG